MIRVACLLSTTIIVGTFSFQRGSHEWVSPGKTYRIVSAHGATTTASQTLEDLEKTWEYQNAQLIPEKGDSPKRQQRIKQLTTELADAQQKHKFYKIQYNTPVTATSVSDRKDRFGLPEAVRVTVRKGELAGKKLWIKYVNVRPYKPINGENAIVNAKGILYAPARSADLLKIKTASGAEIKQMLASGTAFGLAQGTEVKVLSVTVPGLYFVQVLRGNSMGKRYWVKTETLTIP